MRRPATRAPLFERAYRRAALVLWPRERFFAVLCQAGVAVTLPYLADLTERWLSRSGEDHTSLLWREAHELSGHMISSCTGRSDTQRGRRLPPTPPRTVDPPDPAQG